MGVNIQNILSAKNNTPLNLSAKNNTSLSLSLSAKNNTSPPPLSAEQSRPKQSRPKQTRADKRREEQTKADQSRPEQHTDPSLNPSPIPSHSHHPSQHPHTLIPLSTSVHHRCILLFIALYKLWGRAPAWKLRAISMQCQCHVMMTWGACRHACVSASLQLPPHFLHTLCTSPLKGLTPLPLLVFQITHLLPAQTRSKVPAVVHTCVKKYEGWRWNCSGSDDAPVSPKPIRFGALWLKL